MWLTVDKLFSCALCHLFLIYLFIYLFWLHWVFVAARGLSPVAASRGHSSLQCMGFSLQWSTGSRRAGFSSCGSRAQQLWHMGLVAPWHVGSSRTRARTRVPCIGRWILNQCATREVPHYVIFDSHPGVHFEMTDYLRHLSVAQLLAQQAEISSVIIHKHNLWHAATAVPLSTDRAKTQAASFPLVTGTGG